MHAPACCAILSASLATEKESSDINVNLLYIFHKLTLQCQSLINSQSCCTNAEKINKHMVITLQNRSTNLPKVYNRNYQCQCNYIFLCSDSTAAAAHNFRK